MFPHCFKLLKQIFITSYSPKPESRAFLSRCQTQEVPLAKISAAVLTSHEAREVFGVPLHRRGIQPVYLEITNQHSVPLRLSQIEIDSHYYTSSEAAGINHFSLLKRLSTFGLGAFFLFPVLVIFPFKILTISRANRRMDECFRSQSFPLKPIPPGETAKGFVYTTQDAGNKTVRVCLYATGGEETSTVPESFDQMTTVSTGPAVDVSFLIPIPGMSADYLKKDFEEIYPESEMIDCELSDLIHRLEQMPATTTNSSGKKQGDPVNLIVIGELETLLSAFTSRWDECETISLSTCWKTVRAFLLGSEYRYSPVSPLYLFHRSQDVALQRIRGSINERLHLRLWMTPLRIANRTVWIGQISRDIGVRFTLKTWNLTTHRIDPDVDESRDYVVEDLLRAERANAVGYVEGVGACEQQHPRHNLTGDPYYTDGKRAFIAISSTKTKPRYVSWT